MNVPLGLAPSAEQSRTGFFLLRPTLFVDAAAHVVPDVVLCAGILTA